MEERFGCWAFPNLYNTSSEHDKEVDKEDEEDECNEGSSSHPVAPRPPSSPPVAEEVTSNEEQRSPSASPHAASPDEHRGGIAVEMRKMEARMRDSELLLDGLRQELQLNKLKVEELERVNSAQASKLSAIGVRLTASVKELKTQNAAQASERSAIGVRLTAGEKEVKELKTQNAAQASERSAIGVRLTAGEKELKTQNAAQASERSAIAVRLTASEKEVKELKTQNAARKVAFSASLPSGNVGPFKTETKLNCSWVHTNIGQAYNPATGIFTAPIRGVYYLRVTAMGHENGKLAGVKLFHNDKMIMYNVYLTHGTNKYVGNVIVLQLEKGDVIYMNLPVNTRVYGSVENNTNFSGFLLFPM